MFSSQKSRKWRWILWGVAGCVAVGLVGLALVVIVIRSSLQRVSDAALRQFGGGRVGALIASVQCETCTMRERNLGVWALGQMAATPALPVLKMYYTGGKCDHERQLCQYELKKAIRMIETQAERTGPIWNVVAALHRPHD